VTRVGQASVVAVAHAIRLPKVEDRTPPPGEADPFPSRGPSPPPASLRFRWALRRPVLRELRDSLCQVRGAGATRHGLTHKKFRVSHGKSTGKCAKWW